MLSCRAAEAYGNPRKVEQPASQTVCQDANVNFSVTATSTTTMTYQWRFNGANIAGATTSSFTTNNVQSASAGNYSVVLNNTCGPTTSADALLTVLPQITVSASDAIAAEPSNPGVFLITRTGSTSAALTVNFTVGGTATSGTDYTSIGTSVSIPVGQTSATVTVSPVDDSADELDETVNLTLSAHAAYCVGSPSSATVTIQDKPALTVSAPVTIARESGLVAGQFTITRQATDVSAALTVNFTVSGTATSGTDFSSLGTVVTIAAGQTTTNLTVAPIDDSTDEADETVILTLGLNGAAYSLGTSSNATVTIQDKPTVTVTASQPTAKECGLVPGQFTISRQATELSAALTVNYSVGGTATSGSDYTSIGTSVTIAVGQSATNLTLAPLSDALNEADETVILTVTANGAAYNIGSPSSGTVTILSPPVITVQPASQVACQSSNISFTVTATSTTTMTYQWRFNGANIAGATTSSFTTNNVQTGSAGNYSVVLNNTCGSTTSTDATLTVNVPPSITTQPAGQCVALNGTATFSVTATGSAPLSYQWKKDGVNISGATTSSYSKSSVQVSDGGSYTVVVNNSCGSATSTAATLGVMPSITTQPASQIVCQGANVTFSLVATGTTPLSYQWRFNGVNIAGATTSSFTTNNVQSASVGNYSVVVNNTCGSTTSADAALTVNTPPAITAQPQSQTAAVNASVTLSVTASGSPAPSYLWQKNGVALPDKTQATLTFNPVQTTDAGDYAVTVANSCDTVVSTTATLTVATPPTITQQPQSLEVDKGDNATFNVAASGTGPISYQWTFNGANIPGQTSASLTKIDAQTADAGGYAVVVSNPGGSQPSYTANLGVTEAPRACAPSSFQLVAWWPGDGDANDAATSYNNHGTFENADYAAGKVNQSFKFNGTGNHVWVPASPSLNVGISAGLTFEGWVKLTDNASHPVVCWAPDTAGLSGVSLHVNCPGSGGFCANLYDTEGTLHAINSTGGLLVIGGFNHVALTYDKASGIAKLYLNGVVVQTTLLGTFTPRTAGKVFLGYLPSSVPGGPQTFAGIIDEASIYSVALSAEEIRSIFNSRATGKCPPPTITVQASDPVICEAVDDVQGTFVISRSGSTASSLEVFYTFSGTAVNALDYHQLASQSLIIPAGQSSANVHILPIPDTLAEADETVILNLSGGGITHVGSPASATITLQDPPRITTQPQDLSIGANDTATFSVVVAGGMAVSYQWFKGTTALANDGHHQGVTTSTLTINSAQPAADAGAYSVAVINSCGTVTSRAASLLFPGSPNDADYDGRSDIQEVAEGTNPWDPTSYKSVRLGYWRFNDSGVWAGEGGRLPITTQGVLASRPSWSVTALGMHALAGSYLAYRDVETTGEANVNCRSGTVRFWFKPEWPGGAGPGSTARLFEIGHETVEAAGWWGLTLNPLGNRLIFTTQSAGTTTPLLDVPYQFLSGHWYQICLSYDSNLTALYVNGVQIGIGSGVSLWPNPTLRQQGFHIGCDYLHSNQPNGYFEEFETFNYPLATEQVQADYRAVMAVDSDEDLLCDVLEDELGILPGEDDSDGDGMPDGWEVVHGLDPQHNDAVGNPDGDGRTNLQEYQDGTDPLVHEDRDEQRNYYQVASQNLINVDFSPTAAPNTPWLVHGPAAAGSSAADKWNVFTPSTSLPAYADGIALADANGQPTKAKLWVCTAPFKSRSWGWLGNLTDNASSFRNYEAAWTIDPHSTWNWYVARMWEQALSRLYQLSGSFGNQDLYEAFLLLESKMRDSRYWDRSLTSIPIWFPALDTTDPYSQGTPPYLWDHLANNADTPDFQLIVSAAGFYSEGWMLGHTPTRLYITGLKQGNYRLYLYNCSGATVNGRQAELLDSRYPEAAGFPFSRRISVAARDFIHVDSIHLGEEEAADEDNPFWIDLTRSLKIEPSTGIGALQVVELPDLQPPTGVTARDGKLAGFLSWNRVPGADAYIIYRSNSVSSTFVPVGTTVNRTYADTGLMAQSICQYFVVATNEVSVSSPSSIVTVTPFDSPLNTPPVLNWIRPLNLAAENGSFRIRVSKLLEASDAWDADRGTLSFKVESIDTEQGVLKVNGATAGCQWRRESGGKPPV